MKVLVTGGAGFIGSNLVKILLEQGNEVTILDNFSVGRRYNLQNVEGVDIEKIKNLKIVIGSVCNIDLIRKLMINTDIVFHLAVECLVRCNENPMLANEVNSSGTFNICLAAYEAKAKIVYVSSSEVYGTCVFSPMNENHPKEPQSIYGFTKLIGEEYVKFFYKHYQLPSVIIRPFNSYGPNHRNDQYSAVITSFIRRLEYGEYPIIEWTGEQSRDFTYVTDSAEGISYLSKLENCEVVNLGSGNVVSIKDLAILLLKIYEKENDYSKITFVNKRSDDVFKLECDTTLAKKYGFKPKVSMEEGLRKYISWWRNFNKHKELLRINVEHPQET